MKGSVVSVVVLLLGVFPLMVRTRGNPRVCNTLSLRQVHANGLCGDAFTNALDSVCLRRRIRSGKNCKTSYASFFEIPSLGSNHTLNIHDYQKCICSFMKQTNIIIIM